MADDLQLLRRYASDGSEAAFAELVARHVNLVYSVALRRAGGDTHLAQDVAQLVFTDLARKARSLPQNVVLAGWLHRATRYAAAQLIRTERRRQQREQEAVTMNLIESQEAPDWKQIRPLLDEALDDLSRADRDALLLRFMEQRSLAEVGRALGSNEDAARKRVNRALEKLRAQLVRRGVTAAAAALSSAITVNAVQVAPVGLAATLTSASLGTAAAGTGTTLAVLKLMTMTTLQKTLVATTLVAAVGVGIYEAHQASRSREQVQMLRQQQEPLAEQSQRLRRERDDFERQLAALRRDNVGTNRDISELLKLRGEVTRLRNELRVRKDSKTAESEDSMQTEMKTWLARVNQVKQHFEQNPGAKIPELQFLTDEDWLDVGKRDFKSEEDYRRAMADLRMTATTRFGGSIQTALIKYTRDNNGKFPANLSLLEPYLNDSSLGGILLERYQIIPSIYLNNTVRDDIGDWAITQKAAVDEGKDLRVSIGTNSINQSFRTEMDGALDSAINAFATANRGRMPTGIYDLKAFITPAEQEAFQNRIIFNATNLPPNTGPILNGASQFVK